MVLQFIAGLVSGLLPGTVATPILTRAQRGLNNFDPAQILQSASYADALRIDVITRQDYYQYMRELGFSATQAKIFYYNTKVFLSKEDNAIRRIVQSFNFAYGLGDTVITSTANQKILNGIKDEYRKQMYGIGYDADESDKVFEALRPVPTFSILLEWLAKEVFEPEVRTRFKLDDDYPRIWDNLMTTIGVPEFERKAYWAAHWNHPSPGQIGDMYTRWRSDRTDRSESDAKDAGSTVAKLSMSRDDFTEALKLHEICLLYTSPSPRDS